jgi:hypothetical protein
MATLVLEVLEEQPNGKRDRCGVILCEHGRRKYVCKECGGKGLCEHNRPKAQCRECGAGYCEHKRRRSDCKECSGSQICTHNRNRNYCRECNAEHFCPHDRLKSRCKECGGSQICNHGRQRNYCKECGGSQICEHSRVRRACRECSGVSFCKHRTIRNRCKECGGGSICEHDRVRGVCKECGGFLTLAKLMHSHAKKRANKSGVPFNIAVNDILVLIGDGVCPVLGTPYNLSLRAASDVSASLDKFIPSLGYIKGNCFVMSKLANTIKTNATTEQVGRVAEWMDWQQRIVDGEVPQVLKLSGSEYEVLDDVSELFN